MGSRQKERSREQPDSVSLDRVPPQNIDAERAILGAMLLAEESKNTTARAMAAIPTEEIFYGERHRKIYQAICDLFEKSKPIDLVTVTDSLERGNQLEIIGGVPYLNELIDSIPSSANLEYYIEIVIDVYWKRRIIFGSAQLANEGYLDENSGADLVSMLQKMSLDMGKGRALEVSRVKDSLKDVFNTISERAKTGTGIVGLPTGFIDVDDMMAGLHNSEYGVIGARPGMGKSAIIQSMVEYLSVEMKVPSLLFSPEMSKEMVVVRMIGSISGVSAHALRMGSLRDDQWSPITIAGGKLNNAPIFIDDTPGITIQELRSRALLAKEQHDIQIVFVDYIQEVVSPARERREEVEAVSRGLKRLARELAVPVVAASQLSRQVENRPNKRPKLSDLRESGTIEQDADWIAFLYRESYYEKELADDTTEFIITKQRNGPLGTVELYFDMPCLRFENIARKWQQDLPY